MSRRKLDGLNYVVDASAKFSTLRGPKFLSAGKTEMLAYMKTNHGTAQDCMVSTSQVEGNDDGSVMKVDKKYTGFVRSNYVTLANTGEG